MSVMRVTQKRRTQHPNNDAFDVHFGKETSSVGLPQGSHDVDINGGATKISKRRGN